MQNTFDKKGNLELLVMHVVRRQKQTGVVSVKVAEFETIVPAVNNR